MKRKRLIEKEDRISALPDEIIHHILSFVESNVAVQTCVLSKRWVNIWSALSFLNFEPDHFDRNGVYYRKFVSDLLFNRNQQSDTCSIKINLRGFDESVTRMIVDYAISHNVEQFLISGAKIYSALSFPMLRNLSLTWCEVNLVNFSLPYLQTLHLNTASLGDVVWLSFPLLQNLHISACRVPILNWSLPSLTTLHLEYVTVGSGERLMSFEGFHQLKKLTLIECSEFTDVEVVVINSPNLTSLTISHVNLDRPLTCTFMVSAPNLSFFSFEGNCLPMLSAVDGFPSLNQVNLDIRMDKYELKEYNSEEKKNQLIQKLITLFHQLRRTKFLKLSFMTIQVLSRLHRFSEYQTSPFGNLKSLNLLHSYWKSECLANIPDRVIGYLLSRSPCAKIFIEDIWGVRNYNPEKSNIYNSEMNLLLGWTYGYPVIESNVGTRSSAKIDASNEVPKPEVKNK